MNAEVVVPIAVALIVSLTSPYVMARLTARTRRQEIIDLAEQQRINQQKTWDREDELAARTQHYNELMIAQTKETAARLLSSDQRLATEAAAVQGQLTVIHKLVNSGLTASKQATLSAMNAHLFTLKQQTPLDAAAIVALDQDIAAMTAEVERRLRQDRESQVEAHAVSAVAQERAAQTQTDAAAVQAEAAALQAEVAGVLKNPEEPQT